MNLIEISHRPDHNSNINPAIIPVLPCLAAALPTATVQAHICHDIQEFYLVTIRSKFEQTTYLLGDHIFW